MGVVGMDPLFSGCLGSVRQKSQPMEQPCDQWHYEGDGNGEDRDVSEANIRAHEQSIVLKSKLTQVRKVKTCIS